MQRKHQKFWKYVNNKRKNKSNIGDLKTQDTSGNDIIVTEDKDRAEVLGKFFSSVFTQEAQLGMDNLQDRVVNYLNEQPVFTSQSILDKLSNLNITKSPGPDLLHPRVLYEIRREISQPLQIIFTTSLHSGKLPMEWKSANVVAIHKKGNKYEPSNYRPVILTCIICKLMESIIRDNIMSYFFNNDFFSNKQYGFIKGRSTVLQLLRIMDDWTCQLESGSQIDVIYTDFQKAFDKVPHQRLLQKLQIYGVNDITLQWIRDFLCNRKQRVGINNSYSGWFKVESGIPQGSILGPVLFLIYINDLPDFCEVDTCECNIYMYADDAKVYRTIQSKMDEVSLQSTLNKLKEWSDTWLLKLNIDKCKVVSYSVRDKIDTAYYITEGNSVQELERVHSINDLGVIFDSALSFREHMSQKINKAYSMIGIIKRNFIHMEAKTFILLYKALVRPHVEYANSVWNP